jgi:hypothetical protein
VAGGCRRYSYAKLNSFVAALQGKSVESETEMRLLLEMNHSRKNKFKRSKANLRL